MSHQKPYVVKASDWKAHHDDLSPGCTIATVVNGERLNLGLYFMPPGIQTNVFSIEDVDDQTACEWYGPVDEFYYVLAGDELTMYWGEDNDAVENSQSESLILRPGDMGYWARGWKYAVRNTGNAPATWLWGLTLPIGDEKRRDGTTSLD
jgi:mannose-6-phosphate isomerase-like protein (cupin superfamily)